MENKLIVEYVWIGGNNELRSKTRVLSTNDNLDIYKNPEKLPKWNYDGSSTCQAEGHDSEVIIIPRRVFKCPFRKGDNLLVMCDCYDAKGNSLKTNNRKWAKSLFDEKLEEKPWYGIEQEFFMINTKTGLPVGFIDHNVNNKLNPEKQGQYYCSVGANNAHGRKMIEHAMNNMLYAGIDVSGINAEVAVGQWEYQVGPVEGIDAGDQLWMSRYILERTGEEYDIKIEYHPKPLLGDWNGSGCHTNYSTKKMREEGGIEEILKVMPLLLEKHEEHMKLYGSDNQLRMTGKHETASFDKFTYGRANRGASVRIGNSIYEEGKGYFEDRRPSSNMDPYLVIGKIFETTCLI